MKHTIIHAVEQGPWGRKNSGGTGGGSNGGGGWPPTGGGRSDGPNNDFDKIMHELRQYFDSFFGRSAGNRGILLALGALLLMWLASGVYQVQPGEQGVVLRFGKFNRLASSGLSYHIPAPFESVEVVNTEGVRKETMGENTSVATRNGSNTSEILMLTGDENIINLSFDVQWKVRDVKDFVFNVTNPDQSVRAVAESAMREVIGRTKLESALTGGKSTIQDDTRSLTQETLDQYGAGIQILQVNLTHASFPEAVVDAARDVQAARADQERLRNEAEAYTNDILPRARGLAERAIQDAEGYKKEVVARAEGDAARFTSVYEQYKLAEDVTRKRMYLETMEKVLSGMNKMVIDGKGGPMPYLPLPAPALTRNDDKKETR